VRDALRVEPETTKGDRKAFLRFSYDLYRGSPWWVPQPRMSEAALMNREKNPFFQHATAQHFLARRGDRVVGRIAAIENRAHNEFHGDRLGFFGWFDCEKDPEAAAALVASARAWTVERRLDGMRGPVNYSTNDTCGVLVDGFDDRPNLMMPWNREDYDALLKGAGLVPAKDLLAYWVPTETPPPERFARVCARALERGGITLREIDMKEFGRELGIVKTLYNRCWEKNWGFVPMTDAEIDHAAKDLKMIVDPRMFLIAERGGEPVGFVGTLPDLNEALVGLDGRLFPFGLLKLLARRKKISRVRIVMLGVVPEARGKGIDAAFFVESLRRAGVAGYRGGEASWILEDNHRMRADLETVGAKVRKRYRLYECATRSDGR
jgi:GNAT superfamily N-acetyltransferase